IRKRRLQNLVATKPMPKAYMVSSVGSSGPSAKRLAVSLNRLFAPYRQRDRCLMFHGHRHTNFNIVRVGLNEPSDNVREFFFSDGTIDLNVRFRHKADVPTDVVNVRFWG